MSNLAVDAALKASNLLNLINIHSKNVYDNIIHSDLNGNIAAGSQDVWNNFHGCVVYLQNNKYNTCYSSYDRYVDKSTPLNDVGVRVLIKYRE